MTSSGLDKFHQKFVSPPKTDNRQGFEETKGGLIWIDNKFLEVRKLHEKISGKIAFAARVNQADLERICNFVDVESLKFKGMTGTNLAPLLKMEKLTELCLWWCSKLVDTSPLANLTRLEVLCLDDIKRCQDISPIEDLPNLKLLSITGGMWKPQIINSLRPVSEVPNLEELKLTNARVLDGGLRPLAQCASLKTLHLSNQFPTEDYAYLSVRLPKVSCNLFRAYTRGNETLGDKDIMITGKRKPFLSSKTDADRIKRYVDQFLDLQDRFRREKELGV